MSTIFISYPVTPITTSSSTFDVASKGANTVLSNGNLDMTSSSGWTSARLNNGITSGKRYAEFKMLTAGGNQIFGICDSGTLSSFAGAFTNSAGQYGASKNVAGFTDVTAVTVTFAINNVIGIAVDATAKKAWISVNNTWLGSGDPVAGTNEWVSWTGAYTIYPVGSIFSGSDTIRYQQTQTYSPPSGFSVWT